MALLGCAHVHTLHQSTLAVILNQGQLALHVGIGMGMSVVPMQLASVLLVTALICVATAFPVPIKSLMELVSCQRTRLQNVPKTGRVLFAQNALPTTRSLSVRKSVFPTPPVPTDSEH